MQKTYMYLAFNSRGESCHWAISEINGKPPKEDFLVFLNEKMGIPKAKIFDLKMGIAKSVLKIEVMFIIFGELPRQFPKMKKKMRIHSSSLPVYPLQKNSTYFWGKFPCQKWTKKFKINNSSIRNVPLISGITHYVYKTFM